MTAAKRFSAVSVLVSAQLATASCAKAETFSTLITTPLAIEGITSDYMGNLYVPGRTPAPGLPCPVWRVNIANPSLVVVGNVPSPSATGQCSPSGLAFDRFGKLYSPRQIVFTASSPTRAYRRRERCQKPSSAPRRCTTALWSTYHRTSSH
jgi:hypothetical protein